MPADQQQFHAALAALDDSPVNPAGTPCLDRLADPGRRRLLQGEIGRAHV